MRLFGLFAIVLVVFLMIGCEDDSTSPDPTVEWVTIEDYDFQIYIGDFQSYTNTNEFGDPLNPVDSLDWQIAPETESGNFCPDRFAYVDSFGVYMLSDDCFAVKWITTYESDMLGYHIRRSIQPDILSSHRITTEMVASENVIGSHTYLYIDEDLTYGYTYYYWLMAYEDGVEDPGQTGPATIEVGTDPYPAGYPRVYPAYPNSFQDSFTIGFTLNRQSRVIMLLVDEDGALVRELIDSQESAGWHTFTATGIEVETSELLRVFYWIGEENQSYYGYGDVKAN